MNYPDFEKLTPVGLDNLRNTVRVQSKLTPYTNMLFDLFLANTNQLDYLLRVHQASEELDIDFPHSDVWEIFGFPPPFVAKAVLRLLVATNRGGSFLEVMPHISLSEMRSGGGHRSVFLDQDTNFLALRDGLNSEDIYPVFPEFFDYKDILEEVKDRSKFDEILKTQSWLYRLQSDALEKIRRRRAKS